MCKLGYGGTKTEMERLLKDAGKIAGVKFDISSYADVIEAIHVIQEEMDIAGTTTKEAEKTISGSLSAMKASWGNLLPALIKGGDDFDQCVKNLVTSAKTFMGNIKPAIKSALSGVGSLIGELAEIIEQEFPTLVDELLPPLIQAATSLFVGLIKALPTIVKTIAKEIPGILKELGSAIVKAFYEGFTGKKMDDGAYKGMQKAMTGILGGIAAAVAGFAMYKKAGGIFSSITSIFGGKKGGASEAVTSVKNTTNPLASLAKIKTKDVLKGLANIAIIVVGMTALAAAIALVAPYIAQLSDGKSLVETFATIAAVGVLGGVLAKVAKSVGKIPVSKVAKGLANIAIIVGGTALLTLLLGLVTLMDFDYGKIRELALSMAVIGVVGGVLAAIAGAVGMIPIPALVMGLAGIAIVLAGFTLVIAAFGLLAKIPGIQEFLDGGGKLLIQICDILGQMVGAIIGGALSKLSEALPNIGDNIAKFMNKITPLFTAFKGVNGVAIAAFFLSLSGFLLAMAAADLMTFFTGGLDLGQLGSDLSALVTKGGTFFKTVAEIPEKAFTNTEKLFKAIAGSNKLPKDGGIVQLFTGSINWNKIAEGMGALAGEKPKKFYDLVSGYNETTFKNVTRMFEAIASSKQLPKSGGLLQVIMGDINWNKIAEGMGALAGEKPKKFYDLVTNYSETTFKNVANALLAISTSKQLPKTGGVLQVLTGDIQWVRIAMGLGALGGPHAKMFYDVCSNYPETTFKNVANALLAISTSKELPKSGGLLQVLTGDIAWNKIANGLGALAGEKPKKFYDMVDNYKVDTFKKVGAMLSAIANTDKFPKEGGLLQLFTGEVDWDGVAVGMGALAHANVGKLLKFVEPYSIDTFKKMTEFFNALSKIDGLPKEGGVTGWWSGETDWSKLPGLAKHLSAFMKQASVKGGFIDGVKKLQGVTFGVVGKMVWGIEQMEDIKDCDVAGVWEKARSVSAFFDHSGSFTKGVKDMQGLTFGVVGKMRWGIEQMAKITDYDGVHGLWKKADAVSAFFEHAGSFIEGVWSIQGLTFGCVGKMVWGVGQMAKIKDYEIGDIDGKATEISNFMTKAKSFFSEAATINVTAFVEVVKAIGQFYDALGKSAEIESGFQTTFGEIVNIVANSVDTMTEKVSAMPGNMASALSKSSPSLQKAMADMWKDAVTATVAPVNKLLDGANWILKQFDSKERVEKWVPYSEYASGTGGHKGGNALVNDGRGAELIQMPNGSSFIPQGRNVFIPNAPKGMKVLPAEQTASLFGKSKPTFRYAGGTGEIDIWSFLDNAKGLVGAVSKKFVDYKGMTSFTKTLSKGMVSTVSGGMTKWVGKLFDEMGALGIGDYVPSKGVEQWRSTVIRALRMEGLYSPANVERTLMQMRTESGGNPHAINLWDINAKNGTPSKGLMQVIDPTFRTYARAGFNKNIWDPLSNILASLRYARSRYGTLEKAYRGVGYENGGLVTQPGWIGENYRPEMVIPLSRDKRRRAIGLWQDTGSMLGYTPENSVSSYSSKEVSEYNNYSPQFNLTISGSGNDRATERKVKRWVQESMNEFFESLDRKNPKVVEV